MSLWDRKQKAEDLTFMSIMIASNGVIWKEGIPSEGHLKFKGANIKPGLDIKLLPI